MKSALFFAFVCLLAFHSVPSFAQVADFSKCNSLSQSETCEDEGKAVVGSLAAAAAYSSNAANNRTSCPPLNNRVGANWSIRVNVTPKHAPNCDGGTSTPSFVRYYPPHATCAKRTEQTGWKGSGPAGTGSVCSDGCAYSGALDATSPTGLSFLPTGNTCASSDLPPPESVTPGDGGGDGGGTGGETGGGNEGGGGGETGGGGGGGNNGGGGGGGGDGGGEGEGGGEGGGGGGVTPGPGEGDGDGDGDGPGQTTPPDGKLYKKSEKTMEKVVDSFFEKARKTEMVKGITDFMKVPGGGSCPTFTVSATKWWRTMTYSAHCSGDFLALLRLCGFVIFAIAAYAAVRIALT